MHHKLMMSFMITVISLMTLNAHAGQVHSKAFFKNLDHASFMPNIMKHLKKSKDQFDISAGQMKKLKQYHQTNSPKVKSMVKELIELENKAKQMTLDNYPPQMVAKVGKQTLDIRYQLMMMKLKCRSFIKSVLKPEQYKQVLTSYP